MRNKTSMPEARQDLPRDLRWDFSPQALERWSPELMAAATPTDTSISILDAIGVDPWTGEGTTAKRISAALRSIGPKKDITVNINSPGGDLFEGMAIFNILRDYDGSVQVKVMGLAASAASIIAMAGDEVLIARAGFLMVHDTWVVAMGNANDLRATADMLEPFDAAMAAIYSARTGLDSKAIHKMMDNETWISGTAAVDQGFADGLLPADEIKKGVSAKAERAPGPKLELMLAKAGMPRTERRALLQEFKAGTPSAAGLDGTPSATAGTPSAVDVAMNQTMAALAASTNFMKELTWQK